MKRRVLKNKRAVEQAANLYVQFRGENPELVEKVNFKVHPVLMLIGECDGVLYTTRRDGKLEKYIHKFKRSSRPLLASSHDGKQLYLLGGAYDFTERGIVDK